MSAGYVATKHGITHDVFDLHQIEIKEKLDAIAGNTGGGGGSGARHCCVVGTESGNSGTMVQLFGGMTASTSDMYLIGEGFYKETPISGQRLLEFGHISNICFNYCYVKFINTSSTATQVTAKILIRD